MNGIHDLGGTDGMGAVDNDRGTEPVFRADWEKAAFSMFAQGARAGLYTLDEFRHSVEKMGPAEYLLSNYYEHWTHAVEHFAEQKGLIDPDELDKRTQHYLDNPDAPLPERSDPELLDFVNTAVKEGFDASRKSDKSPAFSVVTRWSWPKTAPTGTPDGLATSVARPARSPPLMAPGSTPMSPAMAAGTSPSTCTP